MFLLMQELGYLLLLVLGTTEAKVENGLKWTMNKCQIK